LSEIRFVAPELRRIDLSGAEVLTCGVFRDQRPFTGLAGLLDWRLAGRLSRLARESFLVGETGEALVVPVKQRLPFDKLLAFGLGERRAFDEQTFRSVLARTLDTLSGLAAKKAVVELPGRGDAAIAPEAAGAILLEVLEGDLKDHEPEALVIVEDADAQKRIESYVEERRRAKPRAI
jgi:hypothetical protein